MSGKIISIILLLCFSLAVISLAFFGGSLGFEEAFITIVGGIHNFANTISIGFDYVVEFFETVAVYASPIVNAWKFIFESLGEIIDFIATGLGFDLTSCT